MDDPKYKSKNLFEEIQYMVKLPNFITKIQDPVYTPQDATTLFAQIKHLLKIPPLIQPIQDIQSTQDGFDSTQDNIDENDLNQENDVKINDRCKIDPRKSIKAANSQNGNQFNDKLNNIVNSKLFGVVVKGSLPKETKNPISDKDDDICHVNVKSCKQRTPERKCERKKTNTSLKHFENIMRIDCDLKSKILLEKHNLKYLFGNKKKYAKKVNRNTQSNESISTPSYPSSLVNSYSMPATPSSITTETNSSFGSTISSSSSKNSSLTCKSIINRLRKSHFNQNSNADSYTAYCTKKTIEQSMKKRRSKKELLDFNEKVLIWKQTRLESRSGASTPISGMDLAETPPATPLNFNEETNPIEVNQFNNELSMIINEYEVKNNDNLISNDEFFADLF